MTQSQLSPRMLALIRGVDHLVVGIARHWLLYTNLVLFIFIGLPFLAPALLHFGVEGPARLIYAVYSLTCHQLAYRSWFLFGAQPSYTVGQLQQYLGVNNPPTDILFWRDFIGNPQLGYKMTFCERDIAIYGSALIAGLIYSLVRNRTKPLSWRMYLIFAILPIALDGFTQLFMLRESDPLLRTITGTLFGALSVWMIYPYVNDAMRDAYVQSLGQLQRVQERQRALNPSRQ
jgi:uncharacterized membrane protein